MTEDRQRLVGRLLWCAIVLAMGYAVTRFALRSVPPAPVGLIVAPADPCEPLPAKFKTLALCKGVQQRLAEGYELRDCVTTELGDHFCILLGPEERP